MSGSWPNDLRPKGVLLVLTAPLGVGKRTLCQALIDRHPDLKFSISKTTRSPAPREVDGYDFHFVSDEEFQKGINTGEFLEHTRIHDHWFGTPLGPLNENLALGWDVLLDVDTRGAKDAKAKVPDAALVFVCPTSLEIVAARLRALTPTRPDLVAARMAHAMEELSRAEEFDYVVLSDSLVETADEVSVILRTQRFLARRAGPKIRHMLKNLPPPTTSL